MRLKGLCLCSVNFTSVYSYKIFPLPHLVDTGGQDGAEVRGMPFPYLCEARLWSSLFPRVVGLSHFMRITFPPHTAKAMMGLS